MPTRALRWGRLSEIGKTPGVQKAAALTLFLGALFLHSRLANFSEPVDIARQGAVTAARGQALVVEAPEVKNPLLARAGRPDEIVDVYFTHARLAPQTLERLRRPPFRFTVPATTGPIDYVTENPQSVPGGGEPGRTSIKIALAGGAPRPTRLRFFQRDPSNDPYFEMQVDDAEVEVTLSTAIPPNGGLNAAGCRRLLRVGDWQQSVGPFPIRVVAEKGASFRFRFHPARGNTLWDAERRFAPFPPEAADTASPPTLLAARGVTVETLAAPSRDKPIFRARAVASTRSLLHLADFQVVPDGVQAQLSGTGWAERDGKPVTVDLLTRLKANPLVSGLVGAADAALVAWFLRVCFSKRSAPAPARRRRGGIR